MIIPQPLTDMQFKVVVLGDSQVGKTSILNCQLHGYQPPNSNPTIGCHCNEITMDVDDKSVILQVWDTAGQEMYKSLVPVYLRGARAAIVVYSVTDKESFNSLNLWYKFLHETLSEKIPVFLVANKIDLISPNLLTTEKQTNYNPQYKPRQAVDDDEARIFAEANDSKFFKVSAIKGIGIDDLFTAIAEEMIKLMLTDSVQINNALHEQGGRKKCCF